MLVESRLAGLRETKMFGAASASPSIGNARGSLRHRLPMAQLCSLAALAPGEIETP
jgi:hypothetical protein